MKIFLCPVNRSLKHAPGHLLFAANYLKEVARDDFGQDIEVRYLFFDQKGHTTTDTLKLNLKLAWRILTTRHHAVYYGTDPQNLMLLAYMKSLGLYRKPMYAWKYMALSRSARPLTRWMKRLFYQSFDRIFMLTRQHVEESVKAGMTTYRKCRYIEWGEDLDYIGRIQPARKNSKTTFISTGKAFRDFDTLCQAFEGVDARLKIFTVKQWGPCDYQQTLSRYHNPNIEIHFVDELKLAPGQTILDCLYAELLAADCSLIICKRVNFGVGYTAVLDAMACHTALIATYHKDNPIDIDRNGIGFTSPAEDVDALHTKIQYLVDHPEETRRFAGQARSLVESRYNIRRVARQVLETIFRPDGKM